MNLLHFNAKTWLIQMSVSGCERKMKKIPKVPMFQDQRKTRHTTKKQGSMRITTEWHHKINDIERLTDGGQRLTTMAMRLFGILIRGKNFLRRWQAGWLACPWYQFVSIFRTRFVSIRHSTDPFYRVIRPSFSPSSIHPINGLRNRHRRIWLAVSSR